MKKSIVISDELKSRLDTLKRSLTYEVFLSKVADYLDNSGANLSEGQEPITKYVTSQASRVIEVIRGVEKKQALVHKAIIEQVLKLQAVAPAPVSTFDEREMQHVQELIKINEKQDKEIKELKKENSRLSQASQAIAVAPTEGVNKEAILSLLDNLRAKAMIHYTDKSKFIISQSEFNRVIEAIRKEL